MQNDIQIFNNPEFGSIRAIAGDGGEPYFAATDVAKVLGYRDAFNMTRRLDDDEKGTRSVSTPGGEQELSFITEPGMYSAILGSKIPNAKAFKRWVTHEILPAIRRDGGYIAAKQDEPPEVIMARALKIADETMRRQAAQIDELRPKALFADAVGNTEGLILIRDLAHILRQNGLDTGQNRLFAMLREDGYLEKGRNEPTQRSLDLGVMRVVETVVAKPDGTTFVNRTPKITGKGQAYFVKRYCKGVA